MNASDADSAAASKAALKESRDSLHILDLQDIPLQSTALQRSRLLKNMQLKGIVEVFSGDSTGSGQISPDHLNKYLQWEEAGEHPDQTLIHRLARLNSYDVYSLRIELRHLDIAVNNVEALRLSDDKRGELNDYMTSFTKPLVAQVFGAADNKLNDFDQLVDLFQQANKEEAIKNLRLFAEKLQIELMEVPLFLEEYGDVFLSLAYFKNHLDKIVPRVVSLLDTSERLQRNMQLKADPRFMTTCKYLDKSLNDLITSITGRFESFDRHSAGMWENITAESFRRVRDLVTSQHTTIGGTLCGLSVKMQGWDEKFAGVADDSAIVRRAEYLMGEMRQGIDKIVAIEAAGPKNSDMN